MKKDNSPKDANPNSSPKLETKITQLLNSHNIKITNHHLSEHIRIDKLYEILNRLKKYEISGEFNLDGTFSIDPRASGWDEKDGRPYSMTPTNKYFVWHSHPFRTVNPVDFPSIEDIDTIRLNPHMVGMILTGSGIYFMTSLREIINITTVTSYYRRLQSSPSQSSLLFEGNSNCDQWNYDEISSNFINGNAEKLKDEFGIHIKFVPISEFTGSNASKKILNIVISMYNQLPSIRKSNDIKKYIDMNLLSPTNKSKFSSPLFRFNTHANNNDLLKSERTNAINSLLENLNISTEYKSIKRKKLK